MEIFLLAAAMYWLAAPDRFTAAARTATGTGLRAAGTGAKVHWTQGRDGRALGRTDRRDRWHAKGGWWRKLLGLEHGAVATGKAAKGTGRLVAAAVKPVPGAVRDGWRKGQDRHQARTAGHPVPVALDPPWWRKPDPSPVPAGTGQDSGVASEDSPGPVPGQPSGQAPGGATAGAAIKVWKTSAECGDCGADIDYTTHATCPNCGTGFTSIDSIYPEYADSIQRERPDLPVTTSPGGDPVFENPANYSQAEKMRRDQRRAAGSRSAPAGSGASGAIPSELRTHVAVQDFAQQIDRLGEASDFVMVAEKARTVGAQSRAGGFGGEMDLVVDSLEAAAKRFVQDVDNLRERAHLVAKTSLSVQGS